jgi:hypothetical protein
MPTRTTVPHQQELRFRSQGGKRRGAGRKPRGERAGVSHAARERFAACYPVLVTLKVGPHLPRLRSRRVLARVLPSLAGARERHLLLVHFSVQHDHLHLIVEADGARKHGAKLPTRRLDPCSSAAAFDGWDGEVRTSTHWLARAATRVSTAARTWVLRVGWRRAGSALDPDHRPGPSPQRGSARGAVADRVGTSDPRCAQRPVASQSRW